MAELVVKISLYKEAGIDVYTGGTLFEAFIARNQYDDFCRLMDKLKLEMVEVSDGCIQMEHDKKCHVGGKNICEFCGGTFIIRINLMRHKKLRHSAYKFDEGEPQTCPICLYNAPNFKQFLKHMREQHENKRFYCYICKKSDRNGLKTHMRTVHAGENPFCCEVCQMKFSCYKSFLKHGLIENHIQSKICTICSKTYSSNLAKMVHDRKFHTGGKNICQLCSGTFIVRKNLFKHKKLQHHDITKAKGEKIDKDKPQKCPICLSDAPNFKAFLKHMRKQHENNKFYCYICEKSFTKGLENHLYSVHGEEMLYRCEVCQMKLSSYSAFLKHGIIEKHIQPKTCTLCSKMYLSKCPYSI